MTVAGRRRRHHHHHRRQSPGDSEASDTPFRSELGHRRRSLLALDDRPRSVGRRRLTTGHSVAYTKDIRCWSGRHLLLVALCVLPLLQPVVVDAAVEQLPQWNPRKGCHKVGHRRTISIPDCDRIEVLLNACRGQCLSWAIPSAESGLSSPKFKQRTTSYSNCCRMTEHEEVTYLVRCSDGIRELRFPSALTCDCFDCSHQALRK